MTRITTTVEDAAVRQHLSALQNRLSDLRPLMTEIGADLKARVQLGFTDGLDPWGNPWERLRYREGQPLRDTGRLYNSINYQVAPDGLSVSIGPDDDTGQGGKARMHQFGGRVTRGPWAGAVIPARPYLPIRDGAADLPDDWRADLIDLLTRHLEGA